MALLTVLQLEEFYTNVYDELFRRKCVSNKIWKYGSSTVYDIHWAPYPPIPTSVSVLSVCDDFARKWQEARQALASLPADTFHNPVADVYFELGRRFPKEVAVKVGVCVDVTSVFE
jgi:hypothetical protein